LLVTVGEYAPETGWGDISSSNDAVLIREALARHEFASGDIRQLSDADATRDGIVAALERLIDASAGGDVVVFQFSGHGQQISDDNADELDGYDEALVPYDAPKMMKAGYGGEMHLRDDTVGELVDELRRKVGSAGNVVVLIDSCFSGTGTRGDAPVRGWSVPMELPGAVKRVTGEDNGSGFRDSALPARGVAGGTEAELAPYVVFSAARHDELAYETETDDGTYVGPLSYGISRALANARSEVQTYRRLFEQVKVALQERNVRNTPQLEGDTDSELFSGRAVLQRPFLTVSSVDGAHVRLEAGSLLGLLPETRVEFHSAGAPEPKEETRLAEGKVVRSRLLDATVEIVGPSPRVDLTSSRAFVTAYSFGDLRTAVQLEGFGERNERKLIEERLSRVPPVELVDSGGDFLVKLEPGPSQVMVLLAATGSSVLGPLATGSQTWPDDIARHLQQYALNLYLRRLKAENPDFQVRIEIIPVSVSNCSDPERPTDDSCDVIENPREIFVTAGNDLELPTGTWFKLRLHHSGSREVHVSILDLMPDGRIGLLWPPSPTDKTPLSAAAESVDLRALYQASEPTGVEVLKLIASEEWINLEPLVMDGAHARAEARGRMGEQGEKLFGPIFDALFFGTRADKVFPQGSVAISDVVFTVTP
jgi:hypothetical protein